MIVMTVADVGQLVRTARMSAGLSQAKVAAASGVSRQWLVRLEAGHDGAELVRVLRVLEALGVQMCGEERSPASKHPPPAPTDDIDLDEVLARFGG